MGTHNNQLVPTRQVYTEWYKKTPVSSALVFSTRTVLGSAKNKYNVCVGVNLQNTKQQTYNNFVFSTT